METSYTSLFDAIVFSGLLNLSIGEEIVVLLLLTHITIASVTIFLHRCQAHRALDIHPVVSHFFRAWLWLTTGMVTREWAAVHRKHHAKCETTDDPHSPQIYGISRVLWLGVFLYVKEALNKDTIDRYGHGTPDDWLERNIYAKHPLWGILLMLLISLTLHGVIPGFLMWGIQMLWIPFWAAGVINGVGHWFGYRSFNVRDASVNIAPWGIWIGGEELHNNHHAFPTSAKLSNKWYEFDIGWLYIRLLEMLGLAKVKKVAPVPVFISPRSTCDLNMLKAVIANQHDVRERYRRSLDKVWQTELVRLKAVAKDRADGTHEDYLRCKSLRDNLHRDVSQMDSKDKEALEGALKVAPVLDRMYSMRLELMSLWEHRTSDENLLSYLQNWCVRAEASGILMLEEFSKRLRSYALPTRA